MSKTIADATNYTSGQYNGYLASFGKGEMVDGVGYAQAMIVQSTFPNGVAMLWAWPVGKGNVVAYNQIDFGNYDDGLQTIVSQKVGAIVTLTATHAIALDGDMDNFDVIYDLFTTSEVNAGGTKQHEIEIFLHTPAETMAWLATLGAPSTFTDAAGNVWNAVLDKSTQPHDICFWLKTGKDLLSATINVRAMLGWLIDTKWISQNEFFNGLAVGAEVTQGTGYMSASQFSVVYK